MIIKTWIKLVVFKFKMRNQQEQRPCVDLLTEAGSIKRFYVEDLMDDAFPELRGR